MKIRDYVTGRVLAWLIIAILAAIFGIGRARAQSQGEAFQQCQAAVQGATANCVAGFGPGFTAFNARCVHQPTISRYEARTACEAPWGGTTADVGIGVFQYTTNCASIAPVEVQVNLSKHPGGISAYCQEGCTKNFTSAGTPPRIVTEGPNVGAWQDGTGTATGATCTGEDGDPIEDDDGPDKCPAGKKELPDGTCAKQGECPVGMHEVEATGACTPDGACPTGQQKAPDGSCVAEQCPPGFAKKKDGTCGLDENNDGEPDDEDDGNEDGNKASGGESCETPPTCSGDAIMCMQTKIQWRIDCNTRKQRTVTGGACAAPPVCTGEKCDALEYSSLLMQWRTACALEKGSGGSDMTGTNARLDRIGNFLDGNGQSVPAAPDMPFSELPAEGEEWNSGLGGTASCPAPISTSVSFMGTTVPINLDLTGICQFSVKLRQVVIVLGHFAGLMIIVVGLRK